MLVLKVIVTTSCLVTMFDKGYSSPAPRHRLTIYVPFKIKVLHHHNVEKIPVYILKNIHYHYDSGGHETHFNHESHFDKRDSSVYEEDETSSYEPDDYSDDYIEDDNEEENNSQNFHGDNDYE